MNLPSHISPRSKTGPIFSQNLSPYGTTSKWSPSLSPAPQTLPLPLLHSSHLQKLRVATFFPEFALGIIVPRPFVPHHLISHPPSLISVLILCIMWLTTTPSPSRLFVPIWTSAGVLIHLILHPRRCPFRLLLPYALDIARSIVPAGVPACVRPPPAGVPAVRRAV